MDFSAGLSSPRSAENSSLGGAVGGLADGIFGAAFSSGLDVECDVPSKLGSFGGVFSALPSGLCGGIALFLPNGWPSLAAPTDELAAGDGLLGVVGGIALALGILRPDSPLKLFLGALFGVALLAGGVAVGAGSLTTLSVFVFGRASLPSADDLGWLSSVSAASEALPTRHRHAISPATLSKRAMCGADDVSEFMVAPIFRRAPNKALTPFAYVM